MANCKPTSSYPQNEIKTALKNSSYEQNYLELSILTGKYRLKIPLVKDSSQRKEGSIVV